MKLRNLRLFKKFAIRDGVFAIALTLLILDVKVPSTSEIASEAMLQSFLLKQGPTYLSFALSVVVIGLFWVAHHGLFHYIRRADRTLFWLNILFLLCSCAIMQWLCLDVLVFPKARLRSMSPSLSLSGRRAV